MNAHLSVVLLLTVSLFVPLPTAAQRLALPGVARGFISGRVLLSPDNDPLRGISVTVTLSTGGVPTTVLTDGFGQFEFVGLASGLYFLDVEGRGFEAIRETVQVGFGGDRELTLYLTRTGAPPPGHNRDLVSVRELSIPSKATKEFQKGLQCSAKNDSAGSLLHFQRAVEEYPAYYEAYLQIGFSYRHLGQTAEAEQATRKSIELSGGRFAEADFTLGEILAGQKQYSAAEEATRQGLLLKPASWVGHYILARVLYDLNRLPDAEESAQRVLSLKRDFAKAHLLLANIHIRTHDNVALLKDLDAYLTLDPNGATSVQVSHMRETLLRGLASAKPAAASAAATP